MRRHILSHVEENVAFLVVSSNISMYIITSRDSLPSVFLSPVANEDAESSTRPQASFARRCMFTPY